MKRKIAIICCIALVALSLFTVLAACNKSAEMDDTGLKSVRSALYNYYKDLDENQPNSYEVLASLPGFDVNGNEVNIDVKWTIEGTDKVTVSAKAKDGVYTVNVPDRTTLTDDISYTLNGTLVDSKGQAYKGYNGNADATYSVSFNRKVLMVRSGDPDVVMTFVGTGNITDRGDAFFPADKPTEQNGFTYLTFQEGGLTLKYSQGSNTSNGCLEPGTEKMARFYKSTKLEFTYTGTFKALRFTCGSTSYAEALASTSMTGATVKQDGSVVIISFDTAVSSFTINSMGAQSRVSKIELFEKFVPQFAEKVEGTVDDILTALEALASGETLAGGPHTLTGTITKIVTAYSDQYGNITVNMLVKGETKELEIQCFRMTGGSNLAVDDEITVTGTLKNFNGTFEFDTGCTYVKKGDNPAAILDRAVSSVKADTAYKMFVYKGTATRFFNGNTQSQDYYLDTVAVEASAINVYAEMSGDGFYLYFMKGGSTKTYITIVLSGTHVNAKLTTDTPENGVWKIDATTKIPYMEFGTGKYFLNSSGTYTSIGGADWSKLNQSNLDKSEWAMRLLLAE